MSEINTEDEMLSHIKKHNYIVVYPDKSIKVFQSLRDIENGILISSSNISKKLKYNDYCIIIAKGTKYVYFIKKIY